MAAVAAGGLVGKGRDISLAALQRHDPYINRIVDVASQVALYTFGHRANEWEKTDVEGTLFVYTRSASPKHGFTIMNRLSMENRTEPITKDLDFQLQDPFLLYRNARCDEETPERHIGGALNEEVTSLLWHFFLMYHFWPSVLTKCLRACVVGVPSSEYK
uniref:5'-(N(7)-methylguanosine 5'-triphospho)-[mRNA] hydrolase n=1 Tax=Mandrillus leucophaeus TaxID=9568 RepID=A0A2K5Z9L6_MANLE